MTLGFPKQSTCHVGSSDQSSTVGNTDTWHVEPKYKSIINSILSNATFNNKLSPLETKSEGLMKYKKRKLSQIVGISQSYIQDYSPLLVKQVQHKLIRPNSSIPNDGKVNGVLAPLQDCRETPDSRLIREDTLENDKNGLMERELIHMIYQELKTDHQTGFYLLLDG